eukprot:1087559-Pyramimonas_sp.AAC.1
MYDHFSASHIRAYPDLLSKDSMAILRAAAKLLDVGIPNIEARHASLRRLQIMGSGSWATH